MGRTVSVSAGHPATVLLYDKECEALIRERIPVQRAGAHYRFIHRTFQEHIAWLTDERIQIVTGTPAQISGEDFTPSLTRR